MHVQCRTKVLWGRLYIELFKKWSCHNAKNWNFRHVEYTHSRIYVKDLSNIAEYQVPLA